MKLHTAENEREEKEVYKILIEVKDGWFDINSPIGWYSTLVRDAAKEAIRDAVVEQFMKVVKIPEIEIPDDEIRAAVKERMVDEIMRRKN